MPYVMGINVVARSGIGVMKEIEDAMVVADVQVILMDYTKQAMQKLDKADVKY